MSTFFFVVRLSSLIRHKSDYQRTQFIDIGAHWARGIGYTLRVCRPRFFRSLLRHSPSIIRLSAILRSLVIRATCAVPFLCAVYKLSNIEILPRGRRRHYTIFFFHLSIVKTIPKRNFFSFVFRFGLVMSRIGRNRPVSHPDPLPLSSSQYKTPHAPVESRQSIPGARLWRPRIPVNRFIVFGVKSFLGPFSCVWRDWEKSGVWE